LAELNIEAAAGETPTAETGDAPQNSAAEGEDAH
jgi:hypothetical protein